MKMMPQQYCLRWKHHHSNVQNMFAQLLEKERFCDVTLYCSPSFSTQVPNKDTVEPENIRGVSLRAHRVVLAACSELLGALLGAHDSLGEPVLVIDGAEPRHLRALLDYMYTGEMSVHHSQLASLLKTAEELRIKGLTDIRWNNKDEPPDCNAGGIITTTTEKTSPQRTSPEPKLASESKMAAENKMATENKMAATEQKVPDPRVENQELCPELRAYMKKEDSDSEGRQEKFNVNGGPPPLIKLPTKEKGNVIKRENSDTDTSSPKRQRLTSGAEHTDDDNTYQSKMDREEWHHGNLDISAERVVNWGPPSLGSCSNAGGDAECGGDDAASGGWSRGGGSDEEWGEPPADIGCFLRTRLRVDGDNSGDEESNEDSNPLPLPLPVATALLSTTGLQSSEMKIDLPAVKASTAKSGPVDPRFSDVVKLNDYLQHGRRPQFWEENYVRRVMEAVRLKELEMKQAAEILGVSYGTLYGRYRDVYGCINRPYRTARDFWQAKGPSEVLERFQRGEISLDSAAHALGVSPNNLSAYVTDVTTEKEFEPIPIEVDPSLKMKPRPYPAHPAPPAPNKNRFKGLSADKQIRKIMVGSLEDEDPIPATVITTHDSKATFTSGTATTTSAGKWPSIRVAQLDTLRSDAPTSPSQLMRTRPDLTIVAAKRADKRDDDTT